MLVPEADKLAAAIAKRQPAFAIIWLAAKKSKQVGKGQLKDIIKIDDTTMSFRYWAHMMTDIDIEIAIEFELPGDDTIDNLHHDLDVLVNP